MSYLIAIGQPYPAPNPSDGMHPIVALQRTESALTVTCYLPDASPEEIELWKSGPFHYGIHTDNARSALSSVPLLVFLFSPGLFFDAGFNIRHTPDETDIQPWLEEVQGNVMMCVLVDGRTNVVLGMRAVGASLQFMVTLRVCMMQQLLEFADRAGIDHAIVAKQAATPPDAVLKNATYYLAGDPSGNPVTLS